MHPQNNRKRFFLGLYLDSHSQFSEVHAFLLFLMLIHNISLYSLYIDGTKESKHIISLLQTNLLVISIPTLCLFVRQIIVTLPSSTDQSDSGLISLIPSILCRCGDSNKIILPSMCISHLLLSLHSFHRILAKTYTGDEFRALIISDICSISSIPFHFIIAIITALRECNITTAQSKSILTWLFTLIASTTYLEPENLPKLFYQIFLFCITSGGTSSTSPSSYGLSSPQAFAIQQTVSFFTYFELSAAIEENANR